VPDECGDSLMAIRVSGRYSQKLYDRWRVTVQPLPGPPTMRKPSGDHGIGSSDGRRFAKTFLDSPYLYCALPEGEI